MRISRHLGGTPRVLTEMDIPALEADPGTYEVRGWFSTANAGLEFNCAYGIPKLLENFSLQDKEGFARRAQLIDWIELEGPIVQSWPPPSHRSVLMDSPLRDKDETAYAREVLTRFMSRAYRRPVTPEEVSGRLSLFEKVRPEKPSFVEAIKVPLAAVLASPHFLYLVEPESLLEEPAGGQCRRDPA